MTETQPDLVDAWWRQQDEALRRRRWRSGRSWGSPPPLQWGSLRPSASRLDGRIGVTSRASRPFCPGMTWKGGRLRKTAVAGAAVLLAGCGPHHAIGVSAPAAGPLIRVDMVDASHGWALTASKVLTTSDGGQTWVTVSTPVAGLDPSRLATVSAVSPSTAWACEPGRWRGAGPQQAAGDYLFQRLLPDRCFVTTNGGQSWMAHDIAGTGGTVANRDHIT